MIIWVHGYGRRTEAPRKSRFLALISAQGAHFVPYYLAMSCFSEPSVWELSSGQDNFGLFSTGPVHERVSPNQGR